MSITLENFGPRTLTVELSHDVVCSAGECGCTSQAVGRVTYSTVSGPEAANLARAGAVPKPSVRAKLAKFPRVLTLRARGLEHSSLSGLPDAVAELPTVKRNPDLRVRPDVAPASSPVTPTPPTKPATPPRASARVPAAGGKE